MRFVLVLRIRQTFVGGEVAATILLILPSEIWELNLDVQDLASEETSKLLEFEEEIRRLALRFMVDWVYTEV